MQHFTLLCCFTLLYLLQGDHLNAQPSAAFQAPETFVQQNPSAASAPADAMQDIGDIYGPVELPVPPPYLFYTLLVALGSGLAVLVYFLYRTLSNKEAEEIDPAAVARSELQRAKEILHSSGAAAYRAYCQKVSDILRSFTEQRTGCQVSKRTTAESLSDIENQKRLSGDEIDTLGRCFTICDKVKFARFSPQIEEIEALGELARSLVSDNRPGSERGESI